MKKDKKLRLIIAVVSILTVVSVTGVLAAEVVVDAFSDTFQEVTYRIQLGDTFPITQSDFAATALNEALGDHRDLCLEVDGGPVNGDASTTADSYNDYLQMALDPSVTAIVSVQWDGTNATCSVDETGLSSKDLTGGGTNDGIQLRIIDSDGLPVDITMRIYTNASNWAEQTLRLDTVISTGDVVDVFMPFDDFVDQGSGTMNEANVGAVELELDGTVQAGADMTLSFVKSTGVRDYGDLPTGTYAAASHVPNGLRLGDEVDAEVSTHSSTGATGDDTNDADDEDGVTRQTGAGSPSHGGWTNGTVDFTDDSSVDGGSMEITITGGNGYPQVFIDWDNDGTFSAVTLRNNDVFGTALTLPLPEGTHRVYFDVPAGTFDTINNISLPIRVRLSSSGGLSATGAASTSAGGEVEDYIWDFGPNAVTLSDVSAQPNHIWLVAAAGIILLGAGTATLILRKRRRAQI